MNADAMPGDTSGKGDSPSIHLNDARAIMQAQQAIFESTQTLSACPDLDALFRKAVELAREKLGIERCGLFLEDPETGDVYGTYGTNRQGEIVDESSNLFAKNEWWENVFRHRDSGTGEWEVVTGDRREWDGNKSVMLERGWIAITPIYSIGFGGKPIGAFSSDSYLSSSPPNPIQQNALAMFSMVLANIILMKQIETRQAGELRLQESLGRIHEKINSVKKFSKSDMPWTLIPDEIRGLGIPILGVSIEVPAPSEGSFLCHPIGHQRQHSGQLPLEEHPWVRDAWESGKPIQYTKVSHGADHPLFVPNEFPGTRTCLVEIPIPGVGSAGFSSDTAESFDSRTIDILTRFAELFGLAWRRAEDFVSLQRSEEEFRWLVENAGDALFLADADLNLITVNQAACDSLGYDREELLGLKVSDYLTDWTVDQLLELVSGIPPGVTITAEGHHLRKDGTEFPAEARISRHERDGRILVLSLVRDISEHNKMEDELRDSNKRLESALHHLEQAQEKLFSEERLRTVGIMASGIAHDFNNALSSIVGFSELLIERPEYLKDEGRVMDFLKLIHTEAMDAAAVVSRLSEFYRAREEDEIMVPVRLSTLVKDAILLTEPLWKQQMRAKGIEVNVEMEFSKVPVMPGNASELRTLLSNLIINAVQAMDVDGTIHISVSQNGSGAENEVILEVKDSGSGMTEEVLERCLDPFFTTKGSGGTGLGLSGVYGIARRHNASLEIESELGRGTLIRIRFPVKESKAKVVLAAPAAGRQLRILVIEDVINQRRMLQILLSELGHIVVAASHGKEGLVKLSKQKFDLVITDQAMPDMSGEQIAREIKSLRNIPVMLLTGFGSFMDESPEGIDHVIGKPVTSSLLASAIEKCMESGDSTGRAE
ncbi:MAG: PAS domain S-box protein [Planctomycetota bacterium]|nr:PAS domain S-box protein [Planctomycetota bacterium]